jgi:lysozyme family protein
MDPLTIFTLAMTYGPTVLRLINSTLTNADLGDALKKEAGPIVKMLEEIGAKNFPNAAPAIHAIGGAILAFDLDTTKWLQGALNNLGASPTLVVDGQYGARTAAAVEAIQTQYGLKVDGLAGNVTRAAINALLQKLPILKVA